MYKIRYNYYYNKSHCRPMVWPTIAKAEGCVFKARLASCFRNWRRKFFLKFTMSILLTETRTRQFNNVCEDHNPHVPTWYLTDQALTLWDEAWAQHWDNSRLTDITIIILMQTKWYNFYLCKSINKLLTSAAYLIDCQHAKLQTYVGTLC